MLTRTAFIIVTVFFAQFISAQTITEAEPSKVIKGLKERVTYIAVSPKGDRVLVGFGEYAALYDIDKGKKIAVFEHDYNNVKEVYFVTFDDDGDNVMTVDAKGKKRIWDANTGELLSGTNSNFGPDPRDIIKLGLLKSNPSTSYYYIQTQVDIPNTKIQAKSAKKGIVNFINTEDKNKVVQTLELKNSDAFHLPPCVISPDGAFFITGTDNGEIHFYALN